MSPPLYSKDPTYLSNRLTQCSERVKAAGRRFKAPSYRPANPVWIDLMHDDHDRIDSYHPKETTNIISSWDSSLHLDSFLRQTCNNMDIAKRGHSTTTAEQTEDQNAPPALQSRRLLWYSIARAKLLLLLLICVTRLASVTSS